MPTTSKRSTWTATPRWPTAGNSPSEVPRTGAIPQEQVFKTREQVNKASWFAADDGRISRSRRVARLARPSRQVRSRSTSPIRGRATPSATTPTRSSPTSYHLDDEKLMYPFYEKAVKSGSKTSASTRDVRAGGRGEVPRLRPYADVSDVGKRPTKGLPQLNFLIYHSGYRWIGATPPRAWPSLTRPVAARGPATSRDPGKVWRQQCLRRSGGSSSRGPLWPSRASAAGIDGDGCQAGLAPTTCSGVTDALWTGRRSGRSRDCAVSKIPEDMQQKYGSSRWSGDGLIKNASLPKTPVRLYKFRQRARTRPARPLCRNQADYVQNGPGRSNLRYG